jgi:hypothetical protein
MNAEYQEEARRLAEVSRRFGQGRITCESKSDHGASFDVHSPMRKEPLGTLFSIRGVRVLRML